MNSKDTRSLRQETEKVIDTLLALLHSQINQKRDKEIKISASDFVTVTYPTRTSIEKSWDYFWPAYIEVISQKKASSQKPLEIKDLADDFFVYVAFGLYLYHHSGESFELGFLAHAVFGLAKVQKAENIACGALGKDFVAELQNYNKLDWTIGFNQRVIRAHKLVMQFLKKGKYGM